MSHPVITAIIRTRFLLTSREKASRCIRDAADGYLLLAERLGTCLLYTSDAADE